VRRVPSDPIWQTETSGPEGDVSGPRAPTPAAEASEPPAVGDDARYAREGLLGRGGMGLVYLARDTRLDRAVALKEAARDGDTAARLAREARVTAGLEHPGIVTVHDSGTTAEGRPSYTMRLLRGRPLSTVLAEAGDRSARLLLLRHYLTACQAVAYAHAEGVIHRDLKPANIMVGRFGETQVVDWGLATRSGEGAPPGSGHARDAGDTATGSVLGTPAYMSPEQARGEALGPASDVWSLGAVLYAVLTGKRPRGEGTGDDVLARAKSGELPDLRGLDAPPELLAILERALAAEPGARYANAGVLATDVAAYLDGRRVEAHRYTSWELLARLVRAWRAPLAVAGVAGVAMLALAGAWTVSLARERDRVLAAEREAREALAVFDASLAQALIAEARGAMAEGASGVAAVLAGHAVALDAAPEAWGVLSGVALETRAEFVGEAALPQCTKALVVGLGDVVCVGGDVVRRLAGGGGAVARERGGHRLARRRPGVPRAGVRGLRARPCHRRGPGRRLGGVGGRGDAPDSGTGSRLGAGGAGRLQRAHGALLPGVGGGGDQPRWPAGRLGDRVRRWPRGRGAGRHGAGPVCGDPHHARGARRRGRGGAHPRWPPTPPRGQQGHPRLDRPRVG
jgi:hypothetical protein